MEPYAGDQGDLPLDHEYPPAVCTLPAGHDGMHSNGRCAWAHPWEEACDA